MAATTPFFEALEKFKQFPRIDDYKNSKRTLKCLFFQKLFKEKLKIESSVYLAEMQENTPLKTVSWKPNFTN